jgi:NADPH:quinone reductase-like Zn-dependent oxidoreductase
MKAITYQSYGQPDVLQLSDLPKPTPKANEVLIKIHATVVTAADTTFRRGSDWMARSFTGLRQPKFPVLGDVLAGEIEAVGPAVTKFKPGDQVYGASSADFGAYAEYKCLPEDGPLALKPDNLSYEEAVAVCDGVLTALPFLRDAGQIQAGQKVLINGASGSVGSAGVQLAKYFGAEVTGVCSTSNVALVKSLGADHVIDYTKTDFTQSGQQYDVIFDAVGKRSFSECKAALKPNGIYLSTVIGANILLNMLWTSRFGRKKAKITFAGMRSDSEKAETLRLLKDLSEAGHITPLIDKRYPLQQIAEAHRYVDTGRKKGNVVIVV